MGLGNSPRAWQWVGLDMNSARAEVGERRTMSMSATVELRAHGVSIVPQCSVKPFRGHHLGLPYLSDFIFLAPAGEESPCS